MAKPEVSVAGLELSALESPGPVTRVESPTMVVAKPCLSTNMAGNQTRNQTRNQATTSRQKNIPTLCIIRPSPPSQRPIHLQIYFPLLVHQGRINVKSQHFQNMQLVHATPQIHHLTQLALHLHGGLIQARYTHMLAGHQTPAQLLYLALAGWQGSSNGVNRRQIRLTT